MGIVKEKLPEMKTEPVVDSEAKKKVAEMIGNAKQILESGKTDDKESELFRTFLVDQLRHYEYYVVTKMK